MPDISIPINAAPFPLQVYRNADGSGWMRIEDWGQWKAWTSGDHSDRERARRHRPLYLARAAALITQSSPEDAEATAAKVFRETRRHWRAGSGAGRIMSQWVRHLPVQHYGGTVALYFIPVIGPFISSLASGMTPMILAASKAEIAKHEAGRVSAKFRGDYYNALDAYLADPETYPLPMDFVTYHTEVVVPAAHEMRDQIESGSVTTDTGSYPLTANGLEIWSQQHEDYALPQVGGIHGRIAAVYYAVVRDVYENPGAIVTAVLAGAATGLGTALVIERRGEQ